LPFRFLLLSFVYSADPREFRIAGSHSLSPHRGRFESPWSCLPNPPVSFFPLFTALNTPLKFPNLPYLAGFLFLVFGFSRLSPTSFSFFEDHSMFFFFAVALQKCFYCIGVFLYEIQLPFWIKLHHPSLCSPFSIPYPFFWLIFFF